MSPLGSFEPFWGLPHGTETLVSRLNRLRRFRAEPEALWPDNDVQSHIRLIEYLACLSR
jgi:hypothetical protein